MAQTDARTVKEQQLKDWGDAARVAKNYDRLEVAARR